MTSLKGTKRKAISQDGEPEGALGPSLAEFYRQLVANFPLGIAVMHLPYPNEVRTWKVIAVNPLASQEIGSTVREFLAILAIVKDGASNKPNPRNLFRQVLSADSALLLGYIGRGDDKSGKRYYALLAFPLAGNCVCLLLQDATLGVKTRGDLLEAKAQMRQMSESLRIVLWRANPGTLDFTYVSEHAEDIFGYWVERWYKETDFWKNNTVPEDWETVAARCAEVAKDGKPRHFECGMFTAKGERRQIRILVRKVATRGNLEQLTGVMTDITDERRAADAARELSSQLLRLQDQERKKISRELHDSLGQYLTGLKINLGILESTNGKLDKSLQHVVCECMSLVTTCMDEVRDVSSLLHPPMLEELGLAAAIRWHAEDFSRHSGLKIRLELPRAIAPLSPAVQIALFRIAQECLTNVYKHAQTDSATVRLAQDERAIVLQVEDHGVGIPREILKDFESAPSSKGVGLRGMRERIRELGGKFEISSKGRGTIIRASIPVQAALAGETPSVSQIGREDSIHTAQSRSR